jgi:hypothetical protein
VIKSFLALALLEIHKHVIMNKVLAITWLIETSAAHQIRTLHVRVDIRAPGHRTLVQNR